MLGIAIGRRRQKILIVTKEKIVFKCKSKKDIIFVVMIFRLIY